MSREDLIAVERTSAQTYRREARVRKRFQPDWAAVLESWAETHERRVEALKAGLLFAAGVE